MSDLDKVCPTCQAPVGQHCVSATGRKTTPHNARIFGATMGKSNQLRPR